MEAVSGEIIFSRPFFASHAYTPFSEETGLHFSKCLKFLLLNQYLSRASSHLYSLLGFFAYV